MTASPPPLAMLINIDVPDLEQGIDFYQRAIGLSLSRRLFGNTVAELVGGGGRLYLLEKPGGSTPVPASTSTRDYQRHWTPVHCDWVVADIEAAVARALAAGAGLEGDIESHAWGRLACLSDPFGHGFCLLQWVAGGYDEVA